VSEPEPLSGLLKLRWVGEGNFFLEELAGVERQELRYHLTVIVASVFAD